MHKEAQKDIIRFDQRAESLWIAIILRTCTLIQITMYILQIVILTILLQVVTQDLLLLLLVLELLLYLLLIIDEKVRCYLREIGNHILIILDWSWVFINLYSRGFRDSKSRRINVLLTLQTLVCIFQRVLQFLFKCSYSFDFLSQHIFKEWHLSSNRFD